MAQKRKYEDERSTGSELSGHGQTAVGSSYRTFEIGPDRESDLESNLTTSKLTDQIILDSSHHDEITSIERILQHPLVRFKLYDFQLKSIRWLLQREAFDILNPQKPLKATLPTNLHFMDPALFQELKGGVLCDEV
jgi:hypothetical protein